MVFARVTKAEQIVRRDVERGGECSECAGGDVLRTASFDAGDGILWDPRGVFKLFLCEACALSCVSYAFLQRCHRALPTSLYDTPASSVLGRRSKCCIDGYPFN